MDPARPAADVAEALGMRAHPEGGWYVETWRAPSVDGARPAVSTILYLLASGERSHWHRVDADEVWQHAGGDPIELRMWTEGQPAVPTVRLSSDLAAGSVVQAVVPARWWQSARPFGAWS